MRFNIKQIIGGSALLLTTSFVWAYNPAPFYCVKDGDPTTKSYDCPKEIADQVRSAFNKERTECKIMYKGAETKCTLKNWGSISGMIYLNEDKSAVVRCSCSP